MKASKPKVILDPYEWMPVYGENKVILTLSGLDLKLKVNYDGSNSTAEKEIVFIGVSLFRRSSFPAPAYNDFRYEDPNGLMVSGSLIQFKSSELAEAYNKHFSGMHSFKHFYWIFLSENVAYEILCIDVIIT